MAAVTPVYPWLTIAYCLASVMLLLVLLTGIIRQNSNLGVTLLCFWLFSENLTAAVNTVVWADNAEVKLYVWCDIVSHLREIAFVVKPMATLIITRRLFLIATSLQSTDFAREAVNRRDIAIEWILGLVIPLLVAGPIYYLNQYARFEVDERLGCTDATSFSVVELLTMESWTILPPLVSIIFYYPKVVRVFYRQVRDHSSTLYSHYSASERTNYMRILLLASVDILLTLPFGIVNITLNLVAALSPPAFFPLYLGWSLLHSDWDPVVYTYTDQQIIGSAKLAQYYFTSWTSPVLAFAIFGLLGLTREARASYRSVISAVCGRLGWKRALWARTTGHSSLGDIEFGMRPTSTSMFDVETGTRHPSVLISTAAANRGFIICTASDSNPTSR
ncbi:unnamed protein product [Peniophora sp. CBMAI 1063]|nr:unnamed protein product [Peniophora sp. CBMAI 1063]